MGRNKKSQIALGNDKKFDMPNMLLGGGAHIELFSNKEAIIDGIRGVLEYNDCYIKLNVGRGTLEFSGSALEISSLDAEGLVICGKIEKIEFCV